MKVHQKWATRSAIMLVLFRGVACLAQLTNFSVNPEADAFVREADPTNNYGLAGSLSVAGVSATNGFGIPGGRADSLVRFQWNEVLNALDAALGNHDWFIACAALRLYEIGAPNNALFSRGIGTFEARWLTSGDGWEEGTGSPNAPTMDGVSFRDLASLVNPAHDVSLGIFTNNGVDGAFTITLPAAFAEHLRSGGSTTFHFTPASDSVGFTFFSRNNPRPSLGIALDLTVVAGPRPHLASIERTNANEVVIHFNTRSNWTHVLQYRDVLATDAINSWSNLFNAPAQTFDSEANVVDVITNPRRFYRLSLSPP